MEKILKRLKKYIKVSLRDSLITLGVFAAAFALCFALQRFSENDFHVPLIFVLVVIIVSRFTDGYLYGLISAAAGVIAVNYVFTYPYFELDFTMTGYPLTFATMLVVSLVTCTMTARIKEQESYIKESEKEKIRADLLRGISHDIRTPLTGISGASELLIEQADMPRERQQELLKDIRSDSEWLIHMVENVLSITRIGDDPSNIKKEPELAEELVGEAVYQFRKQWPDVEVNVNVPEEALFVPMDAMLIGQVIQNILHNSVIHGNCTVIDIDIMVDAENACFTFTDNGCGFIFDIADGETMNSVDPSSLRRSDRQKNMGIGLSVCRTIIKAHGGNMEFKNHPGKGAEVTFTLPI